ncbi:hypothetical protein TREPR_3377 [Treponema primitia ZAS-2]|uniref:Uncharacterized protein n=1 Tax=Treponema primitia (strain ATCC BAA-887 / DSM 12427 / ZAS-2) TaxID=545694 RepID=F5YJN4_TREPZ|nr:hypothetical protein TREPR_3377 [Treponema primitia ZAS-2]
MAGMSKNTVKRVNFQNTILRIVIVAALFPVKIIIIYYFLLILRGILS